MHQIHTKDFFFKKLFQELQKLEYDYWFPIGDFNAVIDHELDKNIINLIRQESIQDLIFYLNIIFHLRMNLI